MLFPNVLITFTIIKAFLPKNVVAAPKVEEVGLRFHLLPPYVFENNTLCSTENGCLSQISRNFSFGADTLGTFSSRCQMYETKDGSQMNVCTRTYKETDTIVYRTSFMDDFLGTSAGNENAVSSGFPVMKIPSRNESSRLRFVTPGGHMLGWTKFGKGNFWKSMSRFIDGVEGGIVGFISGGEEGPEEFVVMSALTHPMAVNVNLKGKDGEHPSLHWGVQGLAHSIPKGFEIEVIVQHGRTSFTDTVLEWGRALKQYHRSYKVPDPRTQFLSYWTDNGAHFYYFRDLFSNYEQVLKYTRAVLGMKDIPIRYFQIDSWWYHKGIGDGVKLWEPLSEVFPRGLKAVYDDIGFPFIAHNRYFSADTDYAIQNGGNFSFAIDKDSGLSLPLDLPFWQHLFRRGKEWGLQTYEQDWLDYQYGMSNLRTNVTLSSWWLDSMAAAAMSENITIQYCMAYSRHALHSVTLPAVTSIRVSEDFVNSNQWRIGHTSLFAHALGLIPFKDVFKTYNFGVDETDTESTSQYCLVIEELEDGTTNKSSVTCNVDCYLGNGEDFHGFVANTHQGFRCSDWNGKYNLTGSSCRNPNTEVHPWCFTNKDQTEWDWCGVKCDQKLEQNPLLEAAVATLSAGPVGIGDEPLIANTDLLMKCCRSDGFILKPSKPLTAIDEYFLSDLSPEIWTTFSSVSRFDFGIIFMSDTLMSYNLTPLQLNLIRVLQVETLVWKIHPKIEVVRLNRANESVYLEKCSGFSGFQKNSLCLHYLSPIWTFRNNYQVAYLGEVTKWTPVSNGRTADIKGFGEKNLFDMDYFLIKIDGLALEKVILGFWDNREGLFNVTCSFHSTGTMSVLITNSQAFCS